MIYKFVKNLFYKIKNYNISNDMLDIKNLVNSINIENKKLDKLSNNDISNKTKEFKLRLKNNENINNILIESFAVVKQAYKRVFKINLFDTQIIAGIVLHNGNIAEMVTGEGKTFSATLPAYLNSLYGKGVHIVTMNDYLTRRDAINNKYLFDFLNITVGINTSGMSIKEKKESYYSDITYGTNNEYGFDYLKDNMVYDISNKIQRDLNYAIIDEIDSILIDESRTPLIISEYNKNISEIYIKINNIVKDFINNNDVYKNKYLNIDFQSKQIYITEFGFELFEKLMIKIKIIDNNNDLYFDKNLIYIKYIINSLKAYIFFKKNIDYIIKNGNILIIDEYTGRISFGKRWSDGMHQSIEAKENVFINNENEILSSITLQNYFSLYKKLSGMTGTASTEKKEFKEVYNLNIISIPTNKPMIREDYLDKIFLTEEEKINEIIKDVILRVNKNQPILIGTVSIEKSELISKYLNKFNIKHQVLNAKHHELEAKIISQAGIPKSVTIATNMAGRGTDIILGGNFKNINIFENNKDNNLIIKKWIYYNKIVIESGGLHVIGTERHESRRIDNQLRGRSGRQGDPGSSQFYLSMEDNLMKFFISNKIINFLKSINVNFGESINFKWVNKAIESAQLKIERKNFNIRKQLILYDNIINTQRNILFKIRDNLLDYNKINEITYNILKYLIHKFIKIYFLNNNKSNLKNIEYFLNEKFSINISINIDFNTNLNILKLEKNIYNNIINNIVIYNDIDNKYNYAKKIIFLKLLDFFWRNHISSIDILKKSIYLRSYANKDPQQEYQIESFNLFKKMIYNWKYKSINILNKIFYLSKNIDDSHNKKVLDKLLKYRLFDYNEIIYLIQCMKIN